MSVRKAAVAGQFYPGRPAELRSTVEQYLNQTRVDPAPEKTVAVVAPHAGYVFSGPTAGFAYARVRGKKPKRVILLGCSHYYGVTGASVSDAGSFETPLGAFAVDTPFAQTLAKETGSRPAAPHTEEHALEVQLPFLGVALGEVLIVPVLFGGPASDWHAQMGKKLAEMADDTDLVVASTDLSHYLNSERAHQLDKTTLDKILTKDCTALVNGLGAGSCSLCGGAAVVAAMAFALARGAESWSILDYRISAETSGDYDRVVGYAAISMERRDDDG